MMDDNASPNDSLVAWGDESMRSDSAEPMYLLGATIFQDSGSEEFDRFVRMKKSRAPKLHWHDLGRGSQKEVMLCISKMPAVTTVVIGAPLSPRKQERARHECMVALIRKLEDKGVHRLVLESRGTADDKRDIRFVDSLRSSKLVTDLRIEHVRGSDEPRLWLPDQVLGAYGDYLCDEVPSGDWEKARVAMEAKTEIELISLS